MQVLFSLSILFLDGIFPKKKEIHSAIWFPEFWFSNYVFFLVTTDFPFLEFSVDFYAI